MSWTDLPTKEMRKVKALEKIVAALERIAEALEK